MRAALTFLLLTATLAAAPSDYLRYEATRNGGRVVIRTHRHAFTAEGYRPVSTEWADVAKILGLSPPPQGKPAGKLSFRLALHKAGDLKLKGEYSVTGDEATFSYRFSAKGGKKLAIRDGRATVTMKFDITRRIVLSSSAAVTATLVRDGKKEAVSDNWTFKLHSDRIHGKPGFQAAIDKAIDTGVAYLKGKQKQDGSYAARKEYAIGTTALCTFTLSSCGVPRDDPSVEKAIAYLVARTPDTTYDRALAIMALDRAYTPPGELMRAHKRGVTEFQRELPEARRAWAMKIAADLEKLASAPGSWAYGKRVGEKWPDSSNTQYAVLGLRAAARLGYKAQPRTWLGVLQHFRTLHGKEELKGSIMLWREGEAVTLNPTRAAARVKKNGHGFRYRGNSAKTTATMTTAAIASLLIAREELQRLGHKLKPKTRAGIDRSVLGAWLWLDRNWAMARVPGHVPWYHRHYYYLYAVERAAVLDRVKRVGSHDWYFEGGAWLLDQQRKSGAWDGANTKDDVNTCFALLFLKRATAPLTLTR